jgi:hypothetical protein
MRSPGRAHHDSLDAEVVRVAEHQAGPARVVDLAVADRDARDALDRERGSAVADDAQDRDHLAVLRGDDGLSRRPSTQGSPPVLVEPSVVVGSGTPKSGAAGPLEPVSLGLGGVLATTGGILLGGSRLGGSRLGGSRFGRSRRAR